MFLEHKSIILVIKIGIMFLNVNTTSVSAQAQPDNFPIGMFIQYNASVYSSTDIDYNYTAKYEFRQWIDKEQLLLEYGLNNAWRDEYFTDIRLACPDVPYLWMDVSSWQVNNYVTISRRLYEITQISTHWIPPFGSLQCFQLHYEADEYGVKTSSSFWYDSQLGIVVESHYVEENIAEGTILETYDESIISSNLDEFNPPSFTQPTSTTIPTTLTTQQLPSPTSTIVSSEIDQQTALNIIIGVGIAIEISLIILILRSKKPAD